MDEKIELKKVRTFGEIIEDSIQFFKQNWKPLLRAYLFICGFFWLTSLVVSIFNQVQVFDHQAKGETVFSLTYFLSSIYEMISFLVITLTILCFIALYKEKDNEPPTVEEVWSYVKYFFFRILGSYLALGMLIIAGTLFCILPGIYFAVVFSLTLPVMVMENSTLSYAFTRSFQLIKSRWWQTLGIIIVSEIIIVAAMFSVGIPTMLVVLGTSFLTNAKDTHVYMYATLVITHLLQFLYVLPLIAVSLGYFSYTEQDDQGALYQRIMNIGKHDADTEQQVTEEY